MSVCSFAPEEYVEVYRLYESLALESPVVDPALTTHDFGLLLNAIQFANNMALALTYDATAAEPFFQLDDFLSTQGDRSAIPLSRDEVHFLSTRLRLLRYNTQSNAGTECLPEPYRTQLDVLLESLETLHKKMYVSPLTRHIAAKQAIMDLSPTR